MGSRSLAPVPPSLDRTIAPLLDPGGTIDAAVEHALFGSGMKELGGMDPDLVDVKKIQHRLIGHVLESLTQRVERGERDQFKPAIQFAIRVIGEQILGLLQAVAQSRSTEVATLQVQPRGYQDLLLRFLTPKRSPLGVAEREKEEVEGVISGIREGVKKLEGALGESFLEQGGVIFEDNVRPLLRSVFPLSN